VSDIEGLLKIMVRLRDPEKGCPWDLEQRFETLVPHTLEEAYEVAEAIRQGDLMALRGELGDLLFQVVFYARLAEEQGVFDFGQVVTSITTKLTDRHPHVFDTARVASAAVQTETWEAYKARERAAQGEGGTLAGVAHALPALSRAVKLQRRAARVGFDWPQIALIYDKIREELDEVRAEIEQENGQTRIEDELGDLLFACTNLARHVRIDPETALRGANRKFERRFARMEILADGPLDALDSVAWESLWERAKAGEEEAR
jgi:ATP diphosphatase